VGPAAHWTRSPTGCGRSRRLEHATSLLDLAVTPSVVEAARGGNGRLPPWFFAALVAWLVVIAGSTGAGCRVRYRGPAR